MTIEEIYSNNCLKPEFNADIWEHLPTIRKYAERVKTVCEIGVRTGNSTSALLYGLSKQGGQYIGYDLGASFAPPPIPGVEVLIKVADSQANGFAVAPCELLLIDGSHQYEHVKRDLENHINASRYIVMHDTAHEWIKWGGDGVYRALHEFLAAHPREWKVIEQHENCNGLTVMEKVT